MKKIILMAALLSVLMAMTAKAQITTPYIDGRTGEWVICEINTQGDAIDINEAPQINDISVALDAVDANGHKLEYLGSFRATYYCPCKRCNGHWGAIDGFGNPLTWGCVAVDPAVIPLHTKLIIDGYDIVFEARDTGSGVDGRHIDIFVPVSHSEALRMPQGERVEVWKYITE